MHSTIAWFLPPRSTRPTRAAVEADVAAYESEVRHRIAERESERIRQQIDAERAWLSDDVATSDFLAEYLPGVAA